MPEIDPKNLSAQLDYRGRGNPPSAHPSSAIANCFPGLECDFRAVWKRLFVGLDLHESDTLVVAVDAGGDAEQQGVAPGQFLVSVDERAVEMSVTGPRQAGEPNVVLTATNLEWTNSVANIVGKAGERLKCVFRSADSTVEATLEVRRLFENGVIGLEAGDPGVLTQGLCSPWQSDYRECGCYYWAASRPDFVNVEIDQNEARGHNWMLKNRTSMTPKDYSVDNPSSFDRPGTPSQVSYEDLYRNWEQELRFIIGGKDEA